MASTPAAASGDALYKGSCHCGFITYTVHLNLANPPPAMGGAAATRCNCNLCHKAGYLFTNPGSDAPFTLLSPPEGESALSDYTFNSHGVHHPFCPKCGVRCFIKWMLVAEGREVHFMKINALTLDGREDGEPMDDLRRIKIRYWDAKGKDLPTEAADEPCEGGVW